MPGRILIVDHLSSNRIMLRVKLSAAYYHVLQATNGAEARAIARSKTLALIVLDMGLPDMEACALCREFKDDPATAHIPIMMLTQRSDPDACHRALVAGADDYLSQPFNDLILHARLRTLLRIHTMASDLALREHTTQALGFAEAPMGILAPKARIAVIADHPDAARGTFDPLAGCLPFEFRFTDPPKLLRKSFGAEGCDAFVLDETVVRKPDGLRLVSLLQSWPETRHAAIIVMVEGRNTAEAAMALDLGACDILETPLDAQEAAQRLRLQVARKRQADQFRRNVRDGLEMALIDPLTGLHNRRFGLSQLERVHTNALETNGGYAVLSVDLDHFKEVNDRFGHAIGDQVLQEAALRLRKHLRAQDVIARIGGEEFMILLPDMERGLAAAKAALLCEAISCRPIMLDNGTEMHQTISVGVAFGGYHAGQSDPLGQGFDVLERADKALYLSKAEGRNRATTATSAA